MGFLATNTSTMQIAAVADATGETKEGGEAVGAAGA